MTTVADGVRYLCPIGGFLCLVSVYEYKGWRFEYDPYKGAWPLRKDSDEPFKRAGAKFWDLLEEFLDLPETEQKSYRVAGGCIPI